MNLRRGALSWTTEGINNAVKYFMDFAECDCGVRSRRTHLSRSRQLQSLIGTNGFAGLQAVRITVACLCVAMLTANCSPIHAQYLQIPVENRGRVWFANDVKSRLMYAQMPQRVQFRQYAPMCCERLALGHSLDSVSLKFHGISMRLGGLINVLYIDKNVNRNSIGID